MIPAELLRQSRIETVAQSLREDIGDGDITAMLIPQARISRGHVITRDAATIAGRAWVEEVFRQVDPGVTLSWQVQDGDEASPGQSLFSMEGPARSLLTAERSALNWLQLLSGVATTCAGHARRVAHTGVQLLDTRKTLPGLRLAQKYAENLEELDQALAAGTDIIMLDEFSLEDMRQAVIHTAGAAKLEASGGVNSGTLVPIAETGVDYISIGALTKDVRAVDLSMRLDTHD